MIKTILALMLVASPEVAVGMVSQPRPWPACLVLSARNYAASSEAVESIAEAVMADCSVYEAHARKELLVLQMRAYQNAPGGIAQMVANAEAATDRMMGDLRRQMRGKVIGMVIEERMKATSEPVTQ